MKTRSRLNVGVRYENSEGPTMPDYGENDPGVLARQDDDDKAENGWTNPLGWTDDGTDDQYVVNMEFKSLDAPYASYEPKDWRFDDNIVESFESEKDAKVSVATSKERWAKEEADRQAEYEKLKEQFEGKPAKKEAKAGSGDKAEAGEGKKSSNKQDKAKGDGDSTPTKKAKAASDKQAQDAAGEQPEAKEEKEETPDKQVKAADEAVSVKKPEEKPKAAAAAKKPKAAAAAAAPEAAPKAAADSDLPADLGGPATKVDASGTPTDKKVAAVQKGHFKIMIDNEPMDVDGDEFDNDQSLIQKNDDPNYDRETESSDPMADDE